MVFYHFRKFSYGFTDVSQIPGHRFPLASILVFSLETGSLLDDSQNTLNGALGSWGARAAGPVFDCRGFLISAPGLS